MRRVLLALAAFLPAVALAGFPFDASVEEMATQAEDSDQRLILLNGPHFEGIKPGLFMLPLQDREEVLRLRDSAVPNAGARSS